MARDIGIDLGTSSVLIYLKGRGIVLEEPSVVAYDTETGGIRKIGREAEAMIGRTPPTSWLIEVANAAPSSPRSKTTTKSASSTIFATPAKMFT